MRAWVSGLVLSVLVLSAAVAAAGPSLPVTPKRTVMDAYWGVPVADDYRWLEDWNDPAVRAWSDAQNGDGARLCSTRLPASGRRAAADRVAHRALSPSWYGMRRARRASSSRSRTSRRSSSRCSSRCAPLDDAKSERVLVDPNALDPSGATAIDFFVPSRDGRRSPSRSPPAAPRRARSTSTTCRAGSALSDEVPRVNGGTAGGSVAWNADGTGLLVHALPGPGRAARGGPVLLPAGLLPPPRHAGGRATATSSARSSREIAEILLTASDDGRCVLADVLERRRRRPRLLAGLAGRTGVFRPVTTFADRVVAAEFGPTDALFLLSLKGAPHGKVLRLPLADPSLAKATVLLPEGDGGIEWFSVSGDLLYVEEIVGGPSRVRVFDPAGERAPGEAGSGSLPLPDPCAVDEFVATGKGAVAFSVSRYTEPDRWLTLGAGREGGGARRRWPDAPRSSFEDIEVRRETAVSKDGTKVPLTILMRRRARRSTAPRPRCSTATAATGSSERPGFSVRRRVWLDQGGVCADAHLRGGGEFGEAWHTAGQPDAQAERVRRLRRLRAVLVDHRYTSPGAARHPGRQQRRPPDGRRCSPSTRSCSGRSSPASACYDMLRSRDRAQRAFNVDRVREHEGRGRSSRRSTPTRPTTASWTAPPTRRCCCPPAPTTRAWTRCSRARCAPRLQAATNSGLPVLLRAEAGTGHVGTPLKARNELSADIYSFLFAQLGVEYREPAK